MIRVCQNPNEYITYGQMNLINDFRAHWAELGLWTRSFMVSTITGFSNLESIRNRLFRIPSDLGEMFEPFFGKDIAEQFQQLLLMYIVSLQNLIAAENNKNQQAVDAAVTELYKNTDAVAEFLARINPYWNKTQWQYLLYDLNEMIVAEMIALLSGDYVKELDIRDRIFKHSLTMGDYMASGVMSYLLPEKAPTLPTGHSF